MTRPLAGRTVALAEARQLEELVALLEQEGASPLRCPLLSILDAPDTAPVQTWLEDLMAGRFHLVILMTGEAVRRLATFAETLGQLEAYRAALKRTPLLCRGPKPIKVLRDLGIAGEMPPRTSAAPTTPGVIQTLRGENLAGKCIGVTLYGSANPVLEGYLREAGATARTVLSYVFAPAADDARVIDLIGQLDAGTVDVIVFTSSPQVDRLWEVAEKAELTVALKRGLEQTQVAAVGPLIADALRQRGVTVHICPEQGWVMKNLVRQIVRAVAGT